jgi:hypothetical protein
LYIFRVVSLGGFTRSHPNPSNQESNPNIYLQPPKNPTQKLNEKMEKGLTMLMHSVIIGIILYMIMIFLLGQKQAIAEDRSVLIAAVVLVYMVLFGHGLPTNINKNII